MSGLVWRTCPFNELSLRELYLMLQLRQDVFVIEQDCIYRDMDDADQRCQHMLAFSEEDDASLVAYLRVLPPGMRAAEPIIGRIIVATAARGNGIGARLVRRGIEFCREQHPGQTIRILAQAQLEGFYRQFGFEVLSDPYMEEGLLHIDMQLPPADAASRLQT